MDSSSARGAAEPLLSGADDVAVDYATRDVEKGPDDLRRRKGRSLTRGVPLGVKSTKPQDFDGLDFEDGTCARRGEPRAAISSPGLPWRDGVYHVLCA